MENEKTLFVMLSNAIGDNNKLETFLVKVFRKKVKRPKKKTFEKGKSIRKFVMNVIKNKVSIFRELSVIT